LLLPLILMTVLAEKGMEEKCSVIKCGETGEDP
jgi:hypothetical protein